MNGSWTNIRYDSLNRLVAATAVPPGGSASYLCWTYDSFGNRLSQTTSSTPCNVANPPVPTNSWGYNSQNRISFASAAPAGLVYDESGNVTSDGSNQYLFDAEGRVCAVCHGDPLLGGTQKTQYIYDGTGARVVKVSIATWSCDLRSNNFNESQAAGYVLDGSGRQLSEVNGSHVWQHTNAFFGGELVATYGSTTLQFHFSDWLGTQRTHTDYAGTNLSGCFNNPFGDNKQCLGSSASEHFFTGKERDSESNLDYFGARYYEATMGRFMTPDYSDSPDAIPFSDLSNPQSLNLYSYVGNNPLSNTDPDGHEKCKDGTEADVCVTATFLEDVLLEMFSQATNVLHQATQTVTNYVTAPRDPGCMNMYAGAGAVAGAGVGGGIWEQASEEDLASHSALPEEG